MSLPVIFLKSGPVAELVLNRPEARNALTPEMICRLADAIKSYAADPELRVLILRAEGTHAFCAGGDLGLSIPLLTGARAPADVWDRRVLAEPQVMEIASLRDYPLHKPVISVIQGACYAAGFEMMLGTDIRFVSPEAVFCLPEVKRGVIPFAGSLVRLPAQIPYCRAMEILLTGSPVSAQEALEIGLVNRILPLGDCLAEARRTANAIAANGPLAVQQVKSTVQAALGRPLQEGFALEAGAWSKVLASEDAREGPRAFLEKRIPRFTGR